MSEDHRIEIGKLPGALEKDALVVFRSFSVDDVAATLEQHFSDTEDLMEASAITQRDKIFWLFNYHIDANPSVRKLAKLVYNAFPEEEFVQTFPKEFARIMDISEDDVSEQAERVHEIGFIKNAIVVGLAAAFVPVEKREEIFTETALKPSAIGLSLYQSEQIVRGAPDFSDVTDPEEIIDVISTRFLVDHERAMELAAAEMGLPASHVETIEKGDPVWRNLRALAGQKMYEQSLYGAIVDFAGGGRSNAFEPEANPEGLPQTKTRFQPQITDRGSCTGSPFVLTTLQAMGKVLQRRKREIVSAIK